MGKIATGKSRPIIIRFLNHKDKLDFINKVIKFNIDNASNTSVRKYVVREHLTTPRQHIFTQALDLRAKKVIATVNSRDGVICIKKDSKKDSKYVYIKSLKEFKEFRESLH